MIGNFSNILISERKSNISIHLSYKHKRVNMFLDVFYKTNIPITILLFETDSLYKINRKLHPPSWLFSNKTFGKNLRKKWINFLLKWSECVCSTVKVLERRI